MKIEEEEEREKIIVRSDGTVTYVGKDIAYQLWKFGLLDKDFYYEPFLEEDGKTLWISTAEPRPDSPHFGGGSRVYNVIDTRQAYLQKIVAQGLRSLKFTAQAEKSIHFSYEMVALSPKSLKELGYQASEEEKDRSSSRSRGEKAWASRRTTFWTAWRRRPWPRSKREIPPSRRARRRRSPGRSRRPPSVISCSSSPGTP